MNIKPISFCATRYPYKPVINYNDYYSSLFDVIKSADVFNKNGTSKEKAKKIQRKTILKQYNGDGFISKIKSGEELYVAGYLKDKNELYILGEPQNVKYYNASGELDREIDLKKCNDSYILSIKDKKSDFEIYRSQHDAWITYKENGNKSAIYLSDLYDSNMKIKSVNCTPESMALILNILKENSLICKKEDINVDFSQYIELLEDKLNKI